jgi:hypothetical protein
MRVGCFSTYFLMAKVIYNRRHLREYFLYGGISGTLFGLAVWEELRSNRYSDGWIVQLGTIAFFFVIMAYVLRLTRRKEDLKSTWTMLLAGMGAVIVGVVVATLISAVLCLVYLPFQHMQDAPSGLNVAHSGVLLTIFFGAILENFSAGGFAAVLVAYVVKPDQTDDETADF